MKGIKEILLMGCCLSLVFMPLSLMAGEHPGAEHSGEEQAAKTAEHPGAEHSGEEQVAKTAEHPGAEQVEEVAEEAGDAVAAEHSGTTQEHPGN